MSAKLRISLLIGALVVVAALLGVALLNRPLLRYRDYKTERVEVNIPHPPAPPPAPPATNAAK
jgi:hypothetical protein